MLSELRDHIAKSAQDIDEALAESIEHIKKLTEDVKVLEGTDQFTAYAILQYQQKRQHELSELRPSPYFSRCDVTDQTWYFGKFSFPEKNIYSWVTPASQLRFAKPGEVSYERPDGERQHTTLSRKDQYLIQDEDVLFFSTESMEEARKLVFQKHFSNRKTGFILPEIVAKMEAAQDKVIRASAKGPLVISGPAGSGKTTLALHRIAYLMQIPEWAEHFPAHSIRVFVQDPGTKSYFDGLLPELGISGVQILTFFDWAMDLLELSNYRPATPHSDERTADLIMLNKLDILHKPLPLLHHFERPTRSRGISQISHQTYNTIKYLNTLYKNDKKLCHNLDNHELDQVDITILLQAYKRTHGSLLETREVLKTKKNHSFKRTTGRFKPEYNLCVVDEFQNYFPTQLQLIRESLNEELQSMIYVGDMNQQTRFGTIKNWESIGEIIKDRRLIKLDKVYRNTKAILHYIGSLGYNVTIPDELPDGCPVETLEVLSIEDAQNIINEADGALVGILAKHQADLEPYESLRSTKNVHIMTINEAQGVEFDTVVLVGNDEKTWEVNIRDYPTPAFAEEKQHINKDLRYIALTRAMRRLIVTT